MTGKGRALLIATDGYSDDTFRQLRAPRADAEALAAVLADPAVGGYEVQSLHNPPAHEANLAIEDLFAAARLDDLVLLYVAGHGIRDDFGQLHLAMTNSRHDRLNATAVSAQFVRNQMDNTRSRRVVVVLDCCFAGAFPPGSTHRAGESVGVLSQLGGRGSAVMTSSSALEYSFESGGDASSTVVGTASPSVFTGALIEGLRSGGADRNGDGLIDVDELYDFIYEHVEAAGKPQTPGLDSQFQGRLIVAASAAATDLPQEFAQALRSPLPAVRLAIVGELSALLNSDDAGSGAAHTALERLTEDDAGVVATAARATLERAETANSPSATATAKSEAVQENPASSPSQPVNVFQRPTVGTSGPAVFAPGKYGAPQRTADYQQQVRSPRLRQRSIIATSFVLVISLIVAVGLFIQLGLPGDDATAPPSPTFVPLPQPPIPLPASVACQYQLDEKTPIRPVIQPPASGEVSAQGIVRVSIRTNIGIIPAILDRSLAPCAVNDFVHRAEQGFYNNTRCPHAVRFLGCGPFRGEVGNPGYTSEAEGFQVVRRGYLSMESEIAPNFTVMLENESTLATAIGTVSEGSLVDIDDKRRVSDGEITVKSVDIQY